MALSQRRIGCTRCAPPSPLQGACGFSPGLQPRAFDADRLHGDRQWHRGSHRRGIAGPGGPAGQAPPDPYRTGDTPPPWQVSVAPATCRPIGVGARGCLARRVSGAADSRSVHRPRPRPHRYRDHRPTTAFLALTGGRVGHPLIPTNGGGGAVLWRTGAPLGMRRPTIVGARCRLVRRACSAAHFPGTSRWPRLIGRHRHRRTSG